MKNNEKRYHLMDNLGKRIKTARVSAGFTQEQLAEEVGVSRTAVARWELNEIEPKLQNLVVIAETLNVSTDYLLSINPATHQAIDLSLSPRAIALLSELIQEIKKNL